ncbi:hypothetical protein EVJ58_g7924 [Rhodofomes roseus]|uniref:Uncharacterized protein n=1 Tax=Rhodofomes roseus TaxID=34475 RepID=A0A4Y9Y576_9APHY|nr:hypothetical protein EVJ58_g7924 [Rhodofomes roseus]
MAASAPATLPGLPLFRSSLWTPFDFSGLPPNIAVRDATWQAYDGHRAIRSVVALRDGSFAISPNATFVPPLPPSSTDQETVLSDGRRGLFEPGYHPQYWNGSNGHLAFIHQVPPDATGIDPAYVTVDSNRKGRTGIFRVGNTNNLKGNLVPAFVQALLTLYELEFQRAEQLLQRDPSAPRALKLRPASVSDALYHLPITTDQLFPVRKNVAEVQRHLLELRAYSLRATFQFAYDEGRFSIPNSHIIGVGCWVRRTDLEVMKRMVWCGVPVWYVSRSFSPGSLPLQSLSPFDSRLSHDPWDDEDHGPRRHIGKRTKKRLGPLAAEPPDADPDPEFHWTTPNWAASPPTSDFPPQLPDVAPTEETPNMVDSSTGPAVSDIPPQPPVVVAPVASPLPPDEEGWTNQPTGPSELSLCREDVPLYAILSRLLAHFPVLRGTGPLLDVKAPLVGWFAHHREVDLPLAVSTMRRLGTALSPGGQNVHFGRTSTLLSVPAPGRVPRGVPHVARVPTGEIIPLGDVPRPPLQATEIVE